MCGRPRQVPLYYAHNSVHSLNMCLYADCDGDVDLTFLIDDSGSLSEADPPGRPQYTWNLLKTFTKNVVRSLPVGRGTRVAAIRFSTDAHLQFDFSSHSDSARFENSSVVIA